MIVCLGFAFLSASAQQTQYSKTPEYKRMLDEIRSASPSPTYIATGRRPQADTRLGVKVEDGAATLQIQTSAARFTIDKVSGELTTLDFSTQGSWQVSMAQGGGCTRSEPLAANESPKPGGHNHWTVSMGTSCGVLAYDFEILTDGLARLTLHASGAAITGNNTRYGAELGLHVAGGGPFFGLGERFWQAGLAGTTLDVRPQDRSGEPGHNWTYVAVPLVYTPGGLGLYADTAFDARFRFDQPDASFDVQFASSPVPIYLFTERDPKAVLSSYTAITGRPQNPPLWTFGPWITALGGKGPVLDLAHRIRDQAMPTSALWVYDQNDEVDNLGWPFWFSNYYGDPRRFVDTLHGQGFRVLTYVHPYIRSTMLPYTTTSPQFERGLKDKLLVTGADGKPAGPRFEPVPVGNIDFTNPEAVDWWQSTLLGAVSQQGFDGWMEDFGEWVRDTDRFAAGTGHTLSELYPLLYHKITTQIAQGLKPDLVSFSRSGSAGSQAFSPAMWGADQSADWSRDYGLPSVVTAGITAGMSGFSTWGPDILSTGSNRDLWMRWVQFGALTPVMRDHIWDKPVGSLNVFSDPATEAFFRQWAVFHSSLLPYFATYAEEAARTGIPIMRHTVLEFPDDPRSATAEYQYLLGHEMLVAPVVEGGQTLRKLYLPKGEWVNFWNGDSLTGGQDVTVDASAIPIVVRAGSILPFKPEEETGTWNWDDPQLLTSSLVWRAYPSTTGTADATFTLPNGTGAHFQQKGEVITIEGRSKTRRAYEIVVRSKRAPVNLRLDGAPFAEYTAAKDGQPASQWWWNPSTNELHARFRRSTFKLEITGVTMAGYEN